MKKLIVLIIAAALCLSLSGCARLEKMQEVQLPSLPDVNAAKESPASTPLVPATEQPTVTYPDVKLEEHVIVGVSSNKQQFMDPQNGTELILSFGYETPLVYIEANDAASQAINEFIATLDETYNTGNDYGVGSATGLNAMLEMATDHYSYVINSGLEGELGFELSSDRTVYVERIDEKILSFVFHVEEYTGDEESFSEKNGYVFDTGTGRRLTLADLSGDAEAFVSVLGDKLVSLCENDPEAYYSQVLDPQVTESGDMAAAVSALVREGSWCFDRDGMCFYAKLNELGPYSSGIIEFHVPYSELEGVLDEKWVPASGYESGKLSLILQSQVEDGSAEIIDRVVVDESGEQLCLAADGMLRDIKLSRVAYSDRFYETDQLWACSYMNDCLLQLSAIIPEGMPNLMISYTDGAGERQRLLLTESGEDGSLILSEDNIEAVG